MDRGTSPNIMSGSKFYSPSSQQRFESGVFRHPSQSPRFSPHDSPRFSPYDSPRFSPYDSPRFSPQNCFRSPNQHHPYFNTPYSYPRVSPANQSFGANTSYSSGSGSSTPGSFIRSPHDTFQNSGKYKSNRKGSTGDSNPGHSYDITLYAQQSMLQDPWKELMQRFEQNEDANC